MARQTQVINGVLQLTGELAGAVQIGAQSLAGSLTILLPNAVPLQGQLVYVKSVNGNQVILDWVVPDQATGSVTILPANTPAVSHQFLTAYNSSTGAFTAGQPSPADLSQDAATNGQVIAWNGTAWAPATPAGATPGGTNGQIQYNNTGTFGGSAATLSAAGSLVIPSGQDITVQDLVNQTGHQLSISITDASNFAINAAGGSQFLIDSAGAITLTPASGHAATLNGVNTINGLVGSGLDIDVSGTDLIQLSGNGVGIINVYGAGVEINNNTTGASVTVPTTGGVHVSASATDAVVITTATGLFQFFGTGGGMTLASQNASIAIDVNGAITLGPNGVQKVNLSHVNISSVPGPYANNAAATGAGLTAGDVYYTATDPRTLAVVF
jgi:hypothetical protein